MSFQSPRNGLCCAHLSDHDARKLAERRGGGEAGVAHFRSLHPSVPVRQLARHARPPMRPRPGRRPQPCGLPAEACAAQCSATTPWQRARLALLHCSTRVARRGPPGGSRGACVDPVRRCVRDSRRTWQPRGRLGATRTWRAGARVRCVELCLRQLLCPFSGRRDSALGGLGGVRHAPADGRRGGLDGRAIRHDHTPLHQQWHRRVVRLGRLALRSRIACAGFGCAHLRAVRADRSAHSVAPQVRDPPRRGPLPRGTAVAALVLGGPARGTRECSRARNRRPGHAWGTVGCSGASGRGARTAEVG